MSYWSTKPLGIADYSGVIIEGSELQPPERMQFEEEAYDDDDEKQALLREDLEEDLEDDEETDSEDSEATEVISDEEDEDLDEDSEEEDEETDYADEGEGGAEEAEVYYFGPRNPGTKTKLRKRKPIATQKRVQFSTTPAKPRATKQLEIEEVDMQERCDRRVAQSSLPPIDMLDVEVSLDRMMKQLESLKDK
eukprot:CAMPEP_0118945250 /NCGR_PEP_ID=MMETSP1169-20130426/41885_1 /TAXON_ID=36882 /ORGANISM="Pyramimonas obovata, Strain CCMP722" /LENGTH=192 /DNA_ID=CAMNT_0006890921 /DNA_START=198 /DNA_END=776 /DNA_ORIENTATION=-